MDHNLRGTAHALAGSGITPLPVNEHKQPLVSEWRSFQKAKPDPDQIDAMFASAHGVAVLCGAASGNLLGIDFDVRRFFDAWRAEVGPLADGLYMEESPSGGVHTFVRCPNAGHNAKLAWAPDESDETGRTIGGETRGDGGYMIVAPTPGYRVIQGDLLNIPTVPQSVADVLLAAVRNLDEAPFTRQELERRERQAREAVAAHARKREARGGRDSPIDTFNRERSIEWCVDAYGYKLGSRGYYVRPGGKSPSVKVLDGRTVHWSSDDPLNDGRVSPNCGVHDAFDLFVHHEHGGDFTAAVRAAAVAFGLNDSPRPSPSREEPGAGWAEPVVGEWSAPPTPSAPAHRAPCPVYAYPKVARDLIEYGMATYSCPADYVAAHVYPVLSACIGNRWVIEYADQYVQPAVIWGGLISDSGTGKTGPFRLVRKPLERRQSKSIKEHEAAKERFEEKEANYDLEMAAFKKGKRPTPPLRPNPPTCPRLFVESTTMEGLAARQLENPYGLGQFIDEASSIVDSLDQYRNGGADLQNYLNMYDAGSITVDRKNKAEPLMHVSRAFLAMSGGYQPGIIRAGMRDKQRESGFLARNFLVMPPPFRKKLPARGIDRGPLDRFDHAVGVLLAMTAETDPETGAIIPNVATLDAGAADLFGEFFEQHQDDLEAAARDKHLKFNLAKMEGGCLRYALIHHLTRYASGEPVDPAVVDVQSMASAIELISWYKAEAARIYSYFRESEPQTEARELAEYIASRGGRMPPATLMSHRRWGGSLERARQHLDSCARAGYGRWEQPERTGKPGRPAKECFVVVADSFPAPASTISATHTESFESGE